MISRLERFPCASTTRELFVTGYTSPSTDTRLSQHLEPHARQSEESCHGLNRGCMSLQLMIPQGDFGRTITTSSRFLTIVGGSRELVALFGCSYLCIGENEIELGFSPSSGSINVSYLCFGYETRLERHTSATFTCVSSLCLPYIYTSELPPPAQLQSHQLNKLHSFDSVVLSRIVAKSVSLSKETIQSIEIRFRPSYAVRCVEAES